MARVLFIYSVETPGYPSSLMLRPISSPEMISMGISYISSFLRSHGHETSLLALSSTFGERSWKWLDKKVRDFSPHMVCFTAVSTQYPFATQVARHIKATKPEAFLLIGGPHVSLNPAVAIRDVYDGVCVGEGENPTLECLSLIENGKAPSAIPNLWIKSRQGEVEANPTRSFLPDLDLLPFPDREMWTPFIDGRPGSRYSVLLGRGCPFRCSYCSNHALRKLAPGPYVRWRSPENILAEIAELHRKHPENREFYLEIETINIHREWAMALCDLLRRFNEGLPVPLVYGVNVRLTTTEHVAELFSAFQKANIRSINIGLESGSEKVRRNTLRREYSNEVIIDSVALARKLGIQITFFNLIGVPGETEEDFRETVRINRTCQPDRHYTSIFFPYPGTDLYEQCLQQGLIPAELDPSRERSVARLDLPGFSRRQIQKAYVWFDYCVYRGHRRFLHLLFTVLSVKARSNPSLEWLYSRMYWAFLRVDRRFNVRSLGRRLMGIRAPS